MTAGIFLTIFSPFGSKGIGFADQNLKECNTNTVCSLERKLLTFYALIPHFWELWTIGPFEKGHLRQSDAERWAQYLTTTTWKKHGTKLKEKGKLFWFFKTENSEYKCLFMWGFRRKSYRAQPPGFPDAFSLHSLWGRIGWQRNCISLVPVKMLKTKGFVSSMISYNYSSLALDNSQSILMPKDHRGKGVSRRFCVHLIDHSLCGAPAFLQISTVGEGMATAFVNLGKYWLMFCTKAVTFTSQWWCGPQLDGSWSAGQGWLGGCPWASPWLTAKFLCYSVEREVEGLGERQQRSYSGSYKFCQGVVDQGKTLLIFNCPCGKSHWRS